LFLWEELRDGADNYRSRIGITFLTFYDGGRYQNSGHESPLLLQWS